MTLDLETIKNQAIKDIRMRWKGGYPSLVKKLVEHIEGIQAANKELRALLREAHKRLMITEGDARYIESNVELANRIAKKLGNDIL